MKTDMRFGKTIAVLILIACAAQAQASSSPVTSYARMAAMLQADAAHGGWLRLASAGQSGQGRRLWVVRLSDPQSSAASAGRVLVMCRQHGDEPASTEAMLGLIHRVALGQDEFLRQKLSRVTLYIVPMVNPDGAEAGTRVNGADVDLNRDWGAFTQPETRAMAQVISIVRPDVVVDAHNWDGGDSLNTDCIEVSRTMLTPLGRAAHALQQQSVQTLTGAGYPVLSVGYGAERDPRLAHRWCTRQGMLSMLVETHAGSPQDTSDFLYRQEMYVALVETLARHYAASGGAERKASQTSGAFLAAREAALFSPVPSLPGRRARETSQSPVRHLRGWLWALAAYGLALWVWGAGRSGKRLIPEHGNWMGQTPRFVPASEKRSVRRPDMRRYQCSPKKGALLPAAVACGRKR